jgi:hypothetical protein
MISELQESDLGCEELLFKTRQIGAATFVSFAVRDPFNGNYQRPLCLRNAGSKSRRFSCCIRDR